MITWFFPPLNSTGSKRAGCFAKYLPDHGWRPVVVCPEWTPDNCAYDDRFVKNIPDVVDVVKVPHVELERSGLKARLRNLLFPNVQPEAYWRGARRVISGLFESRSFAAIWASSPMALQHVLAAWASRKWGVPWVADFRDVYGELKRPPLGDRLKLPARLLVEKRLIRSAAAVVTVSEALAETLAGRHHREVRVVPNGFDPDDVAAGPDSPPPKPPKFNITYTGALLLPQRNPRPVLDALARLIDGGQVDVRDVSLDFYGAAPEMVSRVFQGHRHEAVVRAFARVSARECAEVQRSSAVLLQLAHGDEKGIMTGKIFEYLAAGRPILSVPKDGDCVDELLEETNAGASWTTVDEIAGQLSAWYREWKETGDVRQEANKSAVLKYSRKEQTRQLADVLDCACSAVEDQT